jgi:toxin YoeB
MEFEFSAEAEEDFAYFVKTNPKIARRIMTLISHTCESPFSGIGKPEPLRHSLSGYRSRRITDHHRMVYTVSRKVVKVIQLRYHY